MGSTWSGRMPRRGPRASTHSAVENVDGVVGGTDAAVLRGGTVRDAVVSGRGGQTHLAADELVSEKDAPHQRSAGEVRK